MNADEMFGRLLLLTRKVRNRQKAYYKKPCKGALIAAKVHEKELDELIDEINGVLKLWPEEPADVETDTHS